MRRSGSDKNDKILKEKISRINNGLQKTQLCESLEKNIELLRDLFEDNNSIAVRLIQNKDEDKANYAIVFCEGIINSVNINENVIRPLLEAPINRDSGSLMDVLSNQVVRINDIIKTDDVQLIVEQVTYGDTILLAEGEKQVLLLNTKCYLFRTISEPEGERILAGPREGFTETLIINTSLVQRKLRTNRFKMKYITLGKVTNTKLCVCYIDGIVRPDILQELYRRLEKVDIDGILDSNYITELIEEKRFSPFRTIGYTERPDVVAAKLLEGRVAIIVDGTPIVLTLPYLFVENFQSSEDYYLNYFYTSSARILRILGFFLTISTPAIYIAIVAFHHEMLPTPLLISIASERTNVPFPAVVEAFLLLLVFDILRETGIRMPTGVGQAMSIVGALVIGQAAVSAKIVAAPMIIVVGLTGITNLLVPKLNAPIVYLRMILLFLAGSFGLFGYMFGISCIVIHILNLQSFGMLSVSNEGEMTFQNGKDTVIRAPWWTMITRPKFMSNNTVRMRKKGGDG